MGSLFIPVKNLKDAYKQQTLELEKKLQKAEAKAELMMEYLERQLEKDVVEE